MAAREAWQAAVLERVAAYVDDDAAPPEVDDFGFWSVTDPDDTDQLDRFFDECSMALNFRILPLAGGWRDQPQDFAEDFKTWLALVNRAKWERQPPDKRAGDDLSVEAFIQSFGDGNAPDVTDLLGME